MSICLASSSPGAGSLVTVWFHSCGAAAFVVWAPAAPASPAPIADRAAKDINRRACIELPLARAALGGDSDDLAASFVATLGRDCEPPAAGPRHLQHDPGIVARQAH